MPLNFSSILKWLNKYYSLRGSLSQLPSEIEPTFKLTCLNQEKYIVKISTTPQHNLPLIAAQLEMLQHLLKSPLKKYFPNIIKNKNNQSISLIKFPNSQSYLRVFSYIEGVFWNECLFLSPRHHSSLGKLLGRMDSYLQTFSNPQLHRTYFWDITQTHLAYDKLEYIKDIEVKRIVNYFLLQFQMEVQPKLPYLRWAYIHNDINDSNILVHQKKGLCGFIDFGDSVYSPLINNIAVACCYCAGQDENSIKNILLIIKNYHKILPLKETELDLVYYLIAARMCISICQSYYRHELDTKNPHHFNSQDVLQKNIKYWLKINPLLFQNLLRKSCNLSPKIKHISLKTEMNKRKKLLGKNLSLAYDPPLKIEKAALQYLYDNQGKTYIDCVNNPAHLGHCHPSIVTVLQKQVAILNTNTRYLHDSIIKFAEKLTSTLPTKLKYCYFTNSGSEANDLAIRLSRNFTKAQDIIVLDNAYHGTTLEDINMSPYKFNGQGGFLPKDWVHVAPMPDTYRGKYKKNDKNAGEKYAFEIYKIIENLKKLDRKLLGFIAESLLGVGGQIVLPPNYLKYVYKYIKEAGGVCIADEVQTGFGRVGKCFWGFQLQEVEPDIVVLGKPMGNTHPLAGVVVSAEIANAFNNGMEYFNTFGGNTVSMEVGSAVLDCLKKEDLQNHALHIGNFLLKELNKLKSNYKLIGDVRGCGLFIGLELVKDRKTLIPATNELTVLIEFLKQNGFLVSSDGPLHNVLKFKPPLVFNLNNAKDFIQILKKGLEKL